MREARQFDNEPSSVTAARHFAVSVLSDVQSEAVERVQLMVSELATNAVRHTPHGFEVKIIGQGQELRVEVSDRGAADPKLRSPRPTDPHGRGLRIVETLADDWGFERRRLGKTVWFTLRLAEPAVARC